MMTLIAIFGIPFFFYVLVAYSDNKMKANRAKSRRKNSLVDCGCIPTLCVGMQPKTLQRRITLVGWSI